MIGEPEIRARAEQLIDLYRSEGRHSIAAEEHAFERSKDLAIAGDIAGRDEWRAILRQIVAMNLATTRRG